MRSNGATIRVLCVSFTLTGIAFLLPAFVFAHCDGLDGPVVKAAQKALATGDVKLVLIWLSKNDEARFNERSSKP